MATKRGRSPSLAEDGPPTKRGNNEAHDLQQLNEAASAIPHALPIAAETTAQIADAVASAVTQGSVLPEATNPMGAEVLMVEQQTTAANLSTATPTLMVVAPEFQVVHDSWEAFEEALKTYAKATYQLYVIRSTTSVKRRNLKIAEGATKGDAAGNAGALRKAGLELGVSVEHDVDVGEQPVERTLIPEPYQWYSKSLKCTHGWKDRHRGTGKRGSGVVRSTSCPAKMCVTLQHRGAGPDDWKVVVTKHVRTHNHQLSKELFLYYSENRRIYDPELLTVAGDAPGAAKPSVDLSTAQLTSLIDQANQRTGVFRMLTSSEEQSQQQTSSMTFMMSDALGSTPAAPNGNPPDHRSSKQPTEASSNHFVIRPRVKNATTLASMPPLGAVVLTPGTIPSRALDGGGFCVPRIAVKVHPTWDAFHDYVAQYAFDTAQVFRTRSTVSVASRNAKTLASAAAKAEADGHDVASYASFAANAASPSSRLIPDEYKWFSKLLICTYGWKRRARGKVPRSGEDGGSGPCPAMMLARVERNVDGQWHIVINRQVPEHNHRLNTQVEEPCNQDLLEPNAHTEATLATASLEATRDEPSPSGDGSSLLETDAMATETSVEEAPTASPAQREIVVRVPKLQSVFNSWDDFHASLKAYSDATYQLYRTRTTSSAKGRNKKIAQMKHGDAEGENGENSDNGSDPDTTLSGATAARKIPESWRWYSKTLTCTHGWKERHRGTGKRTAHVVRSTACPVKICATVQYMNPSGRAAATTPVEGGDDSCWRVVVTKHVVDHNHNLSRELYQHYCENRRIYDPELLAIDTSNEGAVVKRKAYVAPDHSSVIDSVSVQGAQPDASQMASQQTILPAQMEVGLAEAATHAPLFSTPGDNHSVGVGVSGATAFQRNVAAVSAASTSVPQQIVPSVVLLPYNTTPSYLPPQAQQPPAQQQQQQFQSPPLQQQQQVQQQPAPVQAAFTANGSHLGRGSGESEGVATLAAAASPGLNAANIVLFNHAGMVSGGFPASGTNVISVACRVHGSSSGASSTDTGPSTTQSGSQAAESANSQAPQCTCFRIAGGGNYVTIVPATDPLPAPDHSFDADDTIFYAEDMEGAWRPSSNVEIEKVTTESGETVWRVPRIVRRYPTWEAFHKYLDAYSAATFQLYRVRTTYSVRSRNVRLRQLAASRGLAVREEGDNGDPSAAVETEQEGIHGLSRAHVVPEEHEWYSKTFLCTHGWKRRSRGSGQRVSHNVRATECPAKVCATLQRTDGANAWSVVVTKHLTEHNHELSEALYQQYSEVRRVRDPEVLAQAEQLWRGGATRRRVFEFLKERSPNHVILMKDVHNLVQRWQAQERRPRQSPQGEGGQDQEQGEQQQQQASETAPPVVAASHDGYMAYFQGGDFVELLSAQGKAPAAAWKLQGKISKTFDKGIRGNAFQLDGSSETKMQLPKAASSSLGLAQRFVIIQLLVPFTRSFSVEICFSDFQKVRRRFVVASAFRETARTALHVQLPLNAADVPRDQWMNLVFDLQTLSEGHFPDTGYRSMESICIGGSCRLKRIFTMKDAPTPSRGSQVVRHADVRDIPRQFVFSATQRGASGALPIPTLYFAMESASGIGGVHGVAVATNSNSSSSSAPKSSRRSQTAPGKAPPKQRTRVVRPGSELVQRRAVVQQQVELQTDSDASKASGLAQQRLRTPARVSTTRSKLRLPQSRVGKVVTVTKEEHSPHIESPRADLRSSRERTFETPHDSELPQPKSASPAQVNRSRDGKKEEMVLATTPVHVPDRAVSPPSSVHSSRMASPSVKSGERSQTLRQSILGEIQHKLASLEDEDERADQRDRELFLRHTSLHSGEWHLQQLRDEDLNDDDAPLLSDDEDDRTQLSSSWRRELNDNFAAPTSDDTLRRSRDDATDKDSIFSFSSMMRSGTIATGKSSSKLFDFDSLLQDVKPLAPSLETKQTRRVDNLHAQLETSINHGISDAEDDADEQELVKLLAAKRSARELLPRSAGKSRGSEADVVNEHKRGSNKEESASESVDEVGKDLAPATDDATDQWAMLAKDPADGRQPIQASEAQGWRSNRHEGDGDYQFNVGHGDTGLSIDLTSELGASDARSVDDLDEEGDYESSIGHGRPTSPQSKPENDDGSTKASHDEDDGDDSSFDFEDLVEDAASSDDRIEDEKAPGDDGISASTDRKSSEPKPAAPPIRHSNNFDSMISKSPRGSLHPHGNDRASLEQPVRMVPAKSPLIEPARRTRDKPQQRKSQARSLKTSHSSELSSSFSARRLQRLLESTDWTAELDAQASLSPFGRSSDRKYNPANYRSPTSSNDVQRSASKGSTRRSSQRPSSRPQTPATASIELVYDPLLRCYYDPVANKYYALAE